MYSAEDIATVRDATPLAFALYGTATDADVYVCVCADCLDTLPVCAGEDDMPNVLHAAYHN